ncbi:MAG: GH3 auxin-responsive promoter family protein [Myxococcota bacterium]
MLLPLLQLSRQPGLVTFEAACRNVAAAQRQFLLDHVRRHKDTRFGRQHGYSSIRTVDDFRQRVTVSGYDAFSPYIDRMLHGEKGVLVPERVEFWSASAGTTGYRKLVPITESYRRQFQSTLHLWLHAVGQDHPRATEGGVVYFAANAHVDVAPDGTPIGNMSGYNFTHVPSVLQRLYAVPLQAFEVPDPAVRSYVVARCALASDITWLIAVSSHSLHALFETLRHDADALLQDLHDGTLRHRLPGEAYAALRPYLGARPDRSRAMAARARFAGGLTPRSAWPGLRLMSCWTHGAGAAFLPEVMAAAPGVPIRGGIYAANEGWIAIPRADGDVPGVLAVQSNFYEFIPVDEAGTPHGDPLLAHELSLRGRYSPVLTNGTGLARYRMDDVVQVDGFHAQAPMLRFVQKAGSALSLRGENTTEAHARDAMHRAMMATGLHPARWAVAASPRTHGAPRYTFLIEWAAQRTLQMGADARLARALDEALCEVHPPYRERRQEGVLDACTVSHVAAGAFARVQLERARHSHAGEQLKTLHVIKEGTIRDLFEVEAEVDGE